MWIIVINHEVRVDEKLINGNLKFETGAAFMIITVIIIFFLCLICNKGKKITEFKIRKIY